MEEEETMMMDDELKFFEDLNCSQSRYLSKEEILIRIELHILDILSKGKEHSFDLVIRNSSNEENYTKSFRLGQKTKKRKFNQQNSVRSYSQSSFF